MESPQIGNTIRTLGDLLGEIIVSQEGPELLESVETIRRNSKSWRGGDESANDLLRETIADLVADLNLTENVVKAFATYFQLVNLAEEYQRVQVLRLRRDEYHGNQQAMDESVDKAIGTLKREGFNADEVQAILNRLEITPVFTAHPTESRRRTIRQILKRIFELVAALNSDETLEFEKSKLLQRLKSHIVLMWQSDETRDRRPTVMDEVRNTGLYFFEETLFEIIPNLYEELESVLANHFPDKPFTIPPFLKYGSWIGGDRDGNPLVTNEVTQTALKAHKELALKRYQSDLFELYELISVSSNRAQFTPEFKEMLERDFESPSVKSNEILDRFRNEPYRQKFLLMARKLEQTEVANRAAWNDQSEHNGYQSAAELLGELHVIRDCLRQNKGQELATGLLDNLIKRVEVFGFHLATLDVRQHASRHRAAVGEILESYRLAEKYNELGEEQKIELLTKLILNNRPLTSRLAFSDETNSLVRSFRLIREAQDKIGPTSMQTYIISMTESVSNMLEVLLLLKDAELLGQVDLVPLFETVDDLKNAPDTMNAIFDNPAYAQHLKLRENKQQIMIGYSDSNKDGGYLRANWMLFTAQRNLAETCQSRDIDLILFHGRGGSLGRGGGPANRAILAQPHESVNGRIRVTEQGEVVSSRYSNPPIARRHLQQLLNAVICSCGSRPQYPQLENWSSMLDQLSALGHAKYRSLVEHDQFLQYFQTATPIDLVENLNLGSRPSRRKTSASLNDLRAIPWVFSWTQSRANIASWFGIGTAIQRWVNGDKNKLDAIREMYQAWPFANTLFKNVHLGLGRADMAIAQLYSQLAPESAKVIFDQIKAEFDLTCEQILAVTEVDNILDTENWLQHSIQVRNPYVDPLNYLQVALLQRIRDEEDIEEEMRQAMIRILSASVNGIAAGLQNVG